MIRRFITLGIASFLLSGSAQAATYTVDSAHSEIVFTVRHLGITKVSGKFGKFEGSFTYDPAKVEASTAEATIDVLSIDTDNQKRDAHLRSCEFFCAERFAQMTFKTKSVTPKGASAFQIVGDLTLHGVTKEITLDATFNGEAAGPDGKPRAGFSATGTLNRKEFGLTWNKLTEAGGVMVGDEVTIRLEIEGVRA